MWLVLMIPEPTTMLPLASVSTHSQYQWLVVNSDKAEVSCSPVDYKAATIAHHYLPFRLYCIFMYVYACIP